MAPQHRLQVLLLRRRILSQAALVKTLPVLLLLILQPQAQPQQIRKMRHHSNGGNTLAQKSSEELKIGGPVTTARFADVQTTSMEMAAIPNLYLAAWSGATIWVNTMVRMLLFSSPSWLGQSVATHA